MKADIHSNLNQITGERLLRPYSVEKLFFQGAENNLSFLGKLEFEGCRGSPILSDRPLWNF